MINYLPKRGFGTHKKAISVFLSMKNRVKNLKIPVL